jgi:hypothetical protein
MPRYIGRAIALYAALCAISGSVYAQSANYPVAVKHALWAKLGKVWMCGDGYKRGVNQKELATVALQAQKSGESALVRRGCEPYGVPGHLVVTKRVTDGLQAADGVRWYAAELVDVNPGAMGYTFLAVFSLTPAALAAPVAPPLPKTDASQAANMEFMELVGEISPDEEYYQCPNRDVIQQILTATKAVKVGSRDAALHRMALSRCKVISRGEVDALGAWGMVEVVDGIWFAVSASRDGEPIDILYGWAS